MIHRREFFAGLGAMALLASCGPAGPGSVTLKVQGAAGMNPGPDGTDRPLTLQVVQLRGSGAFDSADAFALSNPAAALGADLIKLEVIALAPGGTAEKTIALDPGTTILGIIAGFRDPAGKVFRVKASIAPTDTVTFQVNVGAGGVSLVPA